nr:MAG TPA: hypothetical protein [Caudoviricetes sp.]
MYLPFLYTIYCILYFIHHYISIYFAVETCFSSSY